MAESQIKFQSVAIPVKNVKSYMIKEIRKFRKVRISKDLLGNPPQIEHLVI